MNVLSGFALTNWTWYTMANNRYEERGKLMYRLIYDILDSGLLEQIGMKKYLGLLTYLISLVLVVILCIVLRLASNFLMTKAGNQIMKYTKPAWLEIFHKNKLFQRISNFAVPVVISIYSYSLPEYNQLLGKIVGIVNVFVCMLLINSLGNVVNEVYRQYEISNIRPMHSLIQVIAVAAYIVSGIIAVAILLGESPTVLIGGIGAMTAVTSIVFKDAILGFVAGIQLISNDMIRIGDWIEVPKCSANGTVIELSMTTVKVNNFDRTITSIPAYTLISDSFINWRGMTSSGGRRIKRAIFIDASTIQMCDDQMIEKFRGIHLLKGYMNSKLDEISRYNEEHKTGDQPVNSRQITNIGTFRIYIHEYLKNHPRINNDMSVMVRQTEPDDRGVPLELYCFTDTTVWNEYEVIQSDIFDHLYSIVSEFDLRIYQRPSGKDISGIVDSICESPK